MPGTFFPKRAPEQKSTPHALENAIVPATPPNTMAWWPALGLGLALLLFIAAYSKGAYLTAQRRADMVDMLNDCYSGTTEKSGEVR